MSAPSPTTYIPLDSNASSVFNSVEKSKYMCVASLMFVLYDHAITLDKEVEWIWTLRWRLPKIIFLINRYFLTLLIVLTVVPETFYPLSLSFCKFKNNFLELSPIFNFSAAELLMIIRVCSLYTHHKLVVWSLGSLFIVALAGTTAAQVMFKRTYFTALYYDFLPGCYYESESSPNLQWHVWIPALSLEGAFMLLTAWKVVSYRNEMNRIITVLARDSIVYFVIVFAGLVLTVTNSIRPAFNFPFVTPTQCIVSVAVGRMMMNIRGLILDDPEHTVHLRTLEFTSRPNPGSDIEEGA